MQRGSASIIIVMDELIGKMSKLLDFELVWDAFTFSLPVD